MREMKLEKREMEMEPKKEYGKKRRVKSEERKKK